MRLAAYARYSSDLQRPTSIDDQLRLCREHAARTGGTIVAEFSDAALTGTTMERPGLESLIAAAKAGAFDAVLIEALDRLSRDTADAAQMRKIFKYHGVRILTVFEGEATPLLFGLRAAINEQSLEDMAHKVRRGQSGRVAAGFAAGGRAYGYDAPREIGPDGEIVRGLRRINPAEAEVVRGIFAAYLAGESPRSIAARLNRQGVKGPRGGLWNTSTIGGSRSRRVGILHNEAYIGRLVYNKRRFMRDPESRQVVARLNPRDAWTIAQADALRIVDDETWHAVQTLKAKRSGARPETFRRPKRLLSGLVRCGCCGGSYVMYCGTRMQCATRREKGTCNNARTVTAADVEARVLSGLREQLLAPDLVRDFVKEYHRSAREDRAAAKAGRSTAERELREAETGIGRIVAAIEAGTDSAALRGRLAQLEKTREELEGKLASIGRPRVLEVHPNLAAVYRHKLAVLDAELHADPALTGEAARLLRSIIESVVIHPGKARGETSVEIRSYVQSLVAIMQNNPAPDSPAAGLYANGGRTGGI